MATAPQKKFYTPEEYLEFERNSEHKHEYFNGEIFQMTGASRAHNVLTLRIGSLIDRHLQGKPCEVYSNDMRVKVSATGLYAYPDVAVACPPIELERSTGMETLLNPVAIVEVLSPSTEAFDRGDKFNLYAGISSLTEYLLVSQAAYRVDHFTRDASGAWKILMFSGLDASVQLQSIGCALPLATIYEKVVLQPSGRANP